MKPKKVRDLNHYEILNQPLDASREEIEEAYLRLTSVYSDDSPAGYGALSEDEREWMVERIREAYETLMHKSSRDLYDRDELEIRDQRRRESLSAEMAKRFAKNRLKGIPVDRSALEGKRERHRSAQPPASVFDSSRVTGAHLRNIRLAKGASLEEISDITKVKKSYLEAIEEEDTKSFPAPIFMKGFLKAYAKALGLNPVEICEKYLSKD